jgi:hypothetical protein
VLLRLPAQHVADVLGLLGGLAGRVCGQFGGLGRASAGQGLLEGKMSE